MINALFDDLPLDLQALIKFTLLQRFDTASIICVHLGGEDRLFVLSNMITNFLEMSVRFTEQFILLKNRQILNVHFALSADLLTDGELTQLLVRELGTFSVLNLLRHVLVIKSITGMLLSFRIDHGLIDRAIRIVTHLCLILKFFSLTLRRRV